MKKTNNFSLYCLQDPESFLAQQGWFQSESATFLAKACSWKYVFSFFHEITLFPFLMAMIDIKNTTLFFVNFTENHCYEISIIFC